MTNTLKPLPVKSNLISVKEALAELRDYNPPVEPDGGTPPPDPGTPAGERFSGKYLLMAEASTYANGLHALREACEQNNNPVHPKFVRDDGSEIYRPLTFKENIAARVEDYETELNLDGTERSHDDRLRLFNRRWLTSSCGIAHKAKSSKFKLDLICQDLILLPKDFNSAHLPINYSSHPGIELDKTTGLYNQSLTKTEIMEHSGWLAAVEDEKDLLKTYRDIVFYELQQRNKNKIMPEKAMGFWLLNKPSDDQLRALFVGSLGSNSNANGNYDLDNGGSFLQVTPPETP